MSKDPPVDRPSEATARQVDRRRPYHPPRLVRHGTVRELTQGSDDGPGDLGQGPSGT